MPEDLRAGHPTFWQCFGSGPRPALAIHCTLAHSGVWAGMAAQLPELTLEGFDAPGHGRSGDWEDTAEPGGYQRLAAEIAASFLPGADNARDTPQTPAPGATAGDTARRDIIGHSFGATVALRLALAAPAAVRSLTLIEPVFFSAVPGSAAFAQATRDGERLYALLAAGEAETAAQEFTALWGTGQPWESLPASARARFARQMPLVAAINRINFADPAGVLRPGALEAVAAPVLFIEGGRSPAITHEIHRSLAARITGAEVMRIGNAGHMLPLTHPAETAALVRVNLARG